MLKRNQIIAIVGVVILMVVLLSRPITVLRNTQDEAAGTELNPADGITYDSESQRAKIGLNASLIQEIERLEEKRSPNLSKEEQLDLLKNLAAKWDDVDKSSPLGFLFQEMATLEPRFEHWFQAGEHYRAAYTNLQDETIASVLKQRAILAYEQSLELEPENLEAKTGLGSAYVSGSASPMVGIALLQEVVEKEPQHLSANKALGLFSMQSRQFDRAITRFQTVVSIEPDAESYFYLATSYENIGLKNEAIQAFTESKRLAADPTLNQFIDKKIEELSQ